jgi:hypothetical protein
LFSPVAAVAAAITGASLSVAETYSAFPTFNENGLTIKARYATKWYYSSSAAVSEFETSLLSKSFIGCYNSDCIYNDFYKPNAKGSMLACARAHEGLMFYWEILQY